MEFNCYEPVGSDAASVWLVPYSLAGDGESFDHHKSSSTCIIGPVASKVAEQVGNSLATALENLGLKVERETSADD